MNYEHMIMPGGGGACATASAVNWVQVLRKYLGLPVINPDTIIRDAFRTLPVLLDGRVTNSQMEELLIYLQKYALGSVADLRIDNTADHGIQENGNVWRNAQSIGVKGLIPSSGTMKILIYVVQNSSKRILGRHFVLVKGLKITKNTDNTVVTIDVLDSKNTSKNYSYQVQHVYGRDMKSYSLTLVRPNSPADSAILTIDTVVTTFLNPQD